MSRFNWPEGWATRIAAECFDQISTNGIKVKTKDCQESGLHPVIDQGQEFISGFIDDGEKLIKLEGPVIVFGDHTRNIKWVNFDFVPGADGTKVLSAKEYLSPRFAFYGLKNLEIPNKGYSRHFKFLKELEIPLPPLAEQKVIADILDTLLVQVETTKARLERIPDILKTFRQSVLAAAISGKLTEVWRELNKNDNATLLKEYWLHEREKCFNEKQEEDIRSGKIKRLKKFKSPVRPDLETGPIDKYPETWALVSVSEFAECLDSERIPVKKDQRLAAEGLYPYFGANGEVDKVDEYIFDDELVLVTEDETFYGRVKPIAYRFSGKCWVNNHAHVLRAPTKIANDYLCFSLMYYKVIPWLSGTTGRAKLTQAALNSLPIGMPPEKEQIEIVRRVEELFAFADTIEQKVNAALERVNNLTQSILAKAFRGELTADWRAANPDLISGDNRAEALLAKIKTEREALKEQAKPKRFVVKKHPKKHPLKAFSQH